MKVSITVGDTGAREVKRQAFRLTGKLKRATSRAINDTGFDIKNIDLPNRAEKDFDRPTPFTAKRSWRVQKATASSLMPIGYIYVAPIQADYLETQIKGGTRTEDHPVPLRGARLNRFGNMPRRHLKRKGTFSRRVGGEVFTYRRLRKRVELVAFWPRSRQYSKKFRYEQAVSDGVRKRFRRHYKKQLQRELK